MAGDKADRPNQGAAFAHFFGIRGPIKAGRPPAGSMPEVDDPDYDDNINRTYPVDKNGNRRDAKGRIVDQFGNPLRNPKQIEHERLRNLSDRKKRQQKAKVIRDKRDAAHNQKFLQDFEKMNRFEREDRRRANEEAERKRLQDELDRFPPPPLPRINDPNRLDRVMQLLDRFDRRGRRIG